MPTVFCALEMAGINNVKGYVCDVTDEVAVKALVEKIKANCELFAVNADAQVVKGNKAAGARARKVALELMKDLKEFRKASVEAAK